MQNCVSLKPGHDPRQVKKDDPGLQKLVYGAFGLPFGLAMIVICGGELYTSNAAFMPAAVFEVPHGWPTSVAIPC